MSRPEDGGAHSVLEEPDSSRALRISADLLKPPRTVALVGMMGAGKSSVGRRLAAALGLPFFDADCEIEQAAGKTIAEIFEAYGEAEFRRGERQVIARLLQQPPCVLATGGGAILDPATRALMRAHAISIWLRSDLDTLMRRIERRDSRPLLRTPDPRGTLARLLAERAPLYAEADLVVDSAPGPHWRTVEACIQALAGHAPRAPAAPE